MPVLKEHMISESMKEVVTRLALPARGAQSPLQRLDSSRCRIPAGIAYSYSSRGSLLGYQEENDHLSVPLLRKFDLSVIPLKINAPSYGYHQMVCLSAAVRLRRQPQSLASDSPPLTTDFKKPTNYNGARLRTHPNSVT